MASTVEVTQAYRRQSLALRAQTLRDLQKLWPALDFHDLEHTYLAWFTGASTLIQRDRSRAAGLASLYLRAHRVAAGVAGVPRVHLAGPAPAGQLATSLLVTTVVAIKRSVSAGKLAEQAMADAFVQSSGSATRLVLAAGRETVTETTKADPHTAGWQRVTSGTGCAFCRERAGISITSDVVFEAHDHCACSAEPVYS